MSSTTPTSDDQVFQHLQSWLTKAAASDYLPERTGYSFHASSSTSSAGLSPDESAGALLGMTRLRELQLRYKMMLNEFESSAILQRKKRAYLDLFHPYQLTVLHGKYFRSISLAEIAAIEFLYWKKTHERTSNAILPAITIVLADGEFDRQASRFFEQLHAYLDLPGPPALPSMHEEVVRSFFCLPLSQFKAQLVSSTANKLRGSILVSAADHADPADFHDLVQRLQWVCEQTRAEDPHLSTGFAPRVVLKVPSFGGPGMSTWLFHNLDLNPLPPHGLQRIFSLPLANKDEHERIALARNGIPDFFVQQFALAAHREHEPQAFLHLLMRSCESDLEWNNAEIQRVFTRLSNACAAKKPLLKELPHLQGLLTASSWMEIDEYHLPYAMDEQKLTFPELLESLKYQIHEEARMVVFTVSKEFAKMLEMAQQPPNPHVCFVDLEDKNACGRIHLEPPDWLASVSFVTVWFPDQAVNLQLTLDMHHRLFFFLSCIQSKELSGFALRCNDAHFLEAFLAEKKRREEYLQQFFYGQRRIQTFSSLCAGSPAELASYIANKPVL